MITGFKVKGNMSNILSFGFAFLAALLIAVVGVGADLEIDPDPILVGGDHNTIVSGSFTLKNPAGGTGEEENIVITITDLENGGVPIDKDNIIFDPNPVPNLADDDEITIDFTIIIPQFQDPGTYTGIVTAEAQSGEQATADLELTVNSTPTLSITPNPVEMEEERGNDVSQDITVQNIGNTVITLNSAAFVPNPSDFMDDDNETITLDFSSLEFKTLNPGDDPIIVTVKADISDDILLDTYSGNIDVASGAGTFVLQVDVRPQDVCEDEGRIGNLEIDRIDEPNTGDPDDFEPLEVIDIDVRVENNDNDNIKVKFRALLIDKEDDDVLEEETDIAKIKDGDDLNFDLGLTVPADIEDDSKTRYAVYIVASEDRREDDHCDWKRVDIEIEKEDDEVVIDRVNIPEQLFCGDIGEARVRVVNSGIDDQRDVSVRFSILSFDFGETSNIFDIDEQDDQTVLFSFEIPSDTQSGTYAGVVEVLDEDGNFYDRDESRRNFEFNVECAVPKVTASLTLSQASFTARSGSSVTTVATITNTGDSTQIFTLKLTPIGDWTDGIEASFTLAAGESRTEVLDLPIRREGNHVATVQVLADGTVVSTQTILVDASSVISQGSGGAITAGVIGSSFRDQLPLFIIIVILAIAVIALIIWLVSATKGSRGSRGRELREIKESVGRSRRR